MSDGNGYVKKWATRGTLAVAAITISGWLWPRVVGIVNVADNLAWLEQLRTEYPLAREADAENFRKAAEERAELRKLIGQVAEQVGSSARASEEANRQAAIATALSSTNQNLLFQLLALEHKDRGLPPPARPLNTLPPRPPENGGLRRSP